MSDRPAAPAPTRTSSLLVVLLVGAAVSVALGVFGRQHEPAGHVSWLGPFPSVSSMKVWLTLVVLALAVVQLFTALWMYGKLGLRQPTWLGKLHKTTGGLAFVVSLPVAAACLWALGFQSYNTRVLWHGLFGCAFYGAFTSKVLLLHSKRMPGWALPVVAGVALTAVVGAGLTGAVWYINAFGMP